MVLRAMSGADIAYGAVRCGIIAYRMVLRDVRVRHTVLVSRTGPVMPDASPNFSVSDNLGSLEDFNDSFKLDDDKGKQGGVRGWLDAGAKGEEGGVRGFGWEAGAKGEEEEEEEEAGGGCVARGYSLTPRRKRGEEEGGREEMHGINFVSREEEGKGEREGGGRRMGRSASGGKEEREGQITGYASFTPLRPS
eukprot:3182888-Rhodomonas_salina.1